MKKTIAIFILALSILFLGLILIESYAYCDDNNKTQTKVKSGKDSSGKPRITGIIKVPAQLPPEMALVLNRSKVEYKKRGLSESFLSRITESAKEVK